MGFTAQHVSSFLHASADAWWAFSLGLQLPETTLVGRIWALVCLQEMGREGPGACRLTALENWLRSILNGLPRFSLRKSQAAPVRSDAGLDPGGRRD